MSIKRYQSPTGVPITAIMETTSRTMGIVGIDDETGEPEYVSYNFHADDWQPCYVDANEDWWWLDQLVPVEPATESQE